MLRFKRQLASFEDRGPLRVMFLITSMPVGGAETLLVNLIRRMNREHFSPELCCLKQLGPLGEELAHEIPAHFNLLAGKYDLRVYQRLVRLLRQRKIDAIVTVGAGDKMFWGRLAAWRAGVPVVLSALHSTGWPDGISRLNRMLTPLTDAFIGVAKPHGQHLIEIEKFPSEKVCVIPNGVDVDRFSRHEKARRRLRQEVGIPATAPACGIVAALRPEKNHLLFLRAAAILSKQLPDAHYVIVGDGPERENLKLATHEARLEERVHFLGTRSDISEILSMLDLFALTSHNEANPVSILEAMSVGLPVVSTDVGSVSESVKHGETGYLAKAGDAEEIAHYWQELLCNPSAAYKMGDAGRRHVVSNWSLESMVAGYEELIAEIYHRKQSLVASGTQLRSDAKPTETVKV